MAMTKWRIVANRLDPNQQVWKQDTIELFSGETTPAVAKVAVTGSFLDLTNIPASFPPSAHTHDWSTITDRPTTLAGYGITTVDWAVITNAPAVAPQKNADWDATSGVTQILNKPTTWAWSNLTEVPATFTPSTHTHVKANITDFPTTWDWGKLANVPLGAPSGIATLDSTGHVTLSQIPAALVGALQFQGVWDASTNTPTLASGVGSKGYFYKVSVSGATVLDGNSNWHVGDLLIFDGTVWDKVDNYEAVVSVAGRTGAITLFASDISGLSSVATSGSYTDLSNKPTIPAAQVQTDWNATTGMGVLLNKPTFATVATSGNYTDLSNKPTIPVAQVQTDWNATTGMGVLLNKPTLARVATSGDYKDLSNTPTNEWALSDIDESGTPSYYGYLASDGQWYIKQYTSTQQRYVRGVSDYPTNWANRANLTYGLYSEVF